MNRTKRLKGPCSHCGGTIEFPADIIGTVVQCPHCHQTTELQLGEPPQEPTLPRRAIVWTIVVVALLVLVFAGTLIGLRWSRTWVLEHQRPTGQSTNQTAK